MFIQNADVCWFYHVECTINTFHSINEDTDGMDNVIEAASKFFTQLGIDLVNTFELIHSLRLRSRRVDENPQNQVQLKLNFFLSKIIKFIEFLNELLSDTWDNVNALKKTMIPIYSIFEFPQKIQQMHRSVNWYKCVQ